MKFIDRAKRRKPGIYLYRTRRHMWPGTEWGYGGKSCNLDIREVCHAGQCTRHANCRGALWNDLIVKRFTIRLPWWLGWDWITLSLESLLILAFRPRYNDQKNPRKSKVRKIEQAKQRSFRDMHPGLQAKFDRMTWFDWSVRALGVFVILLGLGGWAWTR